MINAHDSIGIARLAAPLPLEFEIISFSVDAGDEKKLLAATERSTPKVHVLQVEASSGAPAHARLTVCEESRLLSMVLLFGCHVLLCVWHSSSESDAVECLQFQAASSAAFRSAGGN